jgi:hypothetical protein
LFALFKRIANELAPRGSGEGTPPPAFSQKRPQTIENKGAELAKERQERQRARKALKTGALSESEENPALGRSFRWDAEGRHPRGFCIDVKTKVLPKKGFVSF